MPPTSPDRIVLTDTQRGELHRLVRAGRTEQRLVHARRRSCWPAADGQPNARIAPVAGYLRGHRPQVAAPLVRRTGGGVAGRCETVRPAAGVHPGAGRPGQGDGLHTAEPTAGCRCRGGRARNWPGRPSATGSAASISSSTVRRWLSEDALKPWQYQSWIFITDPDFTAKAQRVLDLYDRIWDGKPLGAERVRDLRRREDLHPGPLPLPPHPAAGQGPRDAGQPRLPPPRRGGLPGRLRRAPRQGLRPLRGHHRHRPVRATGRPGDDPASPTPRPSGCSGSWTTAPPTAARPRSTGSPSSSPTRSWCTPRCTPPG